MAQTKPCISHESFVSHWAPNPSTERGDNFHLGTHPKESKIIYPSGKFIVVRDMVDPCDVFVYRGHNAKTTVAKFSPNGFWVASADITGKVPRACLICVRVCSIEGSAARFEMQPVPFCAWYDVRRYVLVLLYQVA